MDTPSRRHLLALPQDVLRAICGHLCWWYSPGSAGAFRPAYIHVANLEAMRTEAAACQVGLDNLGRTCTALRAVAHPLLYRAPCLTRATGLGLLVQTLAVRPDLAATVVELHDLRMEVDDADLILETNPLWEEFDEPGITSLAVVAFACMPNLVRAHLRLQGSAHLRLQGSAHYVPDGLLRPYPGNTEMDDIFSPDMVTYLCPDAWPTDVVPVRNPPSLRVLALSAVDEPFYLNFLGLFQKGYLSQLEHLHIHGGTHLSPDYGPHPLQNVVSFALTRVAVAADRLLLLLVEGDAGRMRTRLEAVPLDHQTPHALARTLGRPADGDRAPARPSPEWLQRAEVQDDLVVPWRNRMLMTMLRQLTTWNLGVWRRGWIDES